MKQNFKRENRKFFTYLLLAVISIYILSMNKAKASVAAYTFTSTTSTYSVITGTTLFTSSTARWDDGVSALQTIPFSFTYNGAAYTTLGVSANGFIRMGAVANTSTIYCGLQASDPYSIAGYGTDLVGGTTGATPSTIIVGTRGTAPNRQYVIQWTDVAHYVSTANYVDHWNFQIILNETSNTVQVVWGTSTDVTTMGANACAGSQTESGNVGLLGAATADFNLRSVTNGTNTWATSTAGNAITAVCNMSSTNVPSSGLTFTWTPAIPVAMSFVSCTTSFLNNAQALSRSSTNNQILQVQVVTNGTLTPFNLTSLSLTTAGSTNAGTDIANAKVFYTGVTNTFSTATQFGSTVTNPNGTYTVTGTTVLAEGINYFWVSYDVKATATFGDNLSGCCTQAIGSGVMGTRTPTVTCPAGSQSILQVGIWTAVATVAPHANLGHMLLLSDGTAICKSNGGPADGNTWDKLTPDAQGSYVNGTWTTIAPMINTRLFFSSQVLIDGRLYVAGGEYGTGGAAGEVYDPLTDTWTLTGSPGGSVSDANSAILPDGKVLQALVQGALTGTSIYNPATNVYTAGPTAHGIHNESAWVKLPDNSILYVDRLTTSSERYIPATNTWIVDATLPVSLYDPYGDETGAAFLLPDGRAFFLGSTGHTAYYTPSGSTSMGSWAAGPDIPSGKGTPDAAAAMMKNGKILCAVSPTPTSANHFPSPTTFYEFDYMTNSFALVSAPGGGASLSISCYQTNMLDLPDGTILYAQNQSSASSQYYIYTPAGSQLAAGKPTINTISQTNCTTLSITGTLFNGISEGACYGDDGQMATNYPIIRLTSGSNIYYARTFNWNSTGVQTVSMPTSTDFTLPAALPAGTYSLVVTANGISSDPVIFTTAPTLTSTLVPSAICSGTAFTYSPTSARANATFAWTRAAVAGISNASVIVAQASNPNEVLINTTANPVAVLYTYTITAGTCTNVQSVTVMVNPAPTLVVNSSSNAVCAGTAVTLTATGVSSYSWTGGITNGNSFVPTSTTTYTVTGTGANGCTNKATKTITVNALPTVGVNASATTVCAGTAVTLTGTGASSYSYSGGVTDGNAFTPTATTTYTVTGTDANGCINTSTKTITVNALPTVGVNAIATIVCAGTAVTLTGTGASSYSYSGGVTDGNAFTPTATTTYTVTGTDANGCINTSTKTITVNALPTVGVNATATTVCAGTAVTLTGTGASSYTYSGGVTDGNAFTPTSTTTYTVTGTDANGCVNTATKSVTVNALPTVGVNATATTVCAGTAVTLTGTGASSYTYSGGVTDGNAFTPTATTTYTVAGTDANGCVNTSTKTITVNALPTVGANATATIVCSGTAVTLTGTGAATYSWTGGISDGSSFTPTATTTYTVSGTDANGCVNTSIQTITVNTPSLWYQDSDGDSYGNSSVIQLACTQPLGYVPIGGDCYDAIATAYPGATEICNNGIDDNCNGQIDESCIIKPIASFTSNITKICKGSTITFQDLSNNAPTAWSWIVAGGNPSTSNLQNPVITYSVAGTYSVSLTVSNAMGSNTKSVIGYVTVYAAKPATPGVIIGTTNGLCSIGITTTSYSVAPVSNTTSYTWAAPVGASIASGQGTNVIIINFGSTFTLGNLTVTATNACGTSAARVIALKSIPPPSTVITGPTAGLCPIGIASTTYTTPIIVGATSYNWTVPIGASITSGQGTTAVAVVFGSTFTTGSISVVTTNACGSSAAKVVAVRSIPATPTMLAGIANGLCPSGVSSATYTTTAVAGAMLYNWTVPIGASITSGQGTTAVTVNFGSAFTAGNISLVASNDCGNSVAKMLALKSVPTTPGVIGGQSTGLCSTTAQTYTIAAVVGATSYSWTSPSGTSIITGQGTNAISLSITNFFVTGNIGVVASNACGNSIPKILTIKAGPGMPTTVSGPTTICGLTTASYTCSTAVGTSSYTWTIPTGMSIVSGQGSTQLNVMITTATTGTLKVVAANSCGAATAKSIALTGCLSPVFKFDYQEDFEDDFSFDVYPNPFTDEFTIELTSNANTEITVEVYDLVGQLLVSKQMIGTSKTTMDLSNKTDGVYFVKTIGRNNSLINIQKLIKQ